jgi:hypothetical protein
MHVELSSRIKLMLGLHSLGHCDRKHCLLLCGSIFGINFCLSFLLISSIHIAVIIIACTRTRLEANVWISYCPFSPPTFVIIILYSLKTGASKHESCHHFSKMMFVIHVHCGAAFILVCTVRDPPCIYAVMIHQNSSIVFSPTRNSQALKNFTEQVGLQSTLCPWILVVSVLVSAGAQVVLIYVSRGLPQSLQAHFDTVLG